MKKFLSSVLIFVAVLAVYASTAYATAPGFPANRVPINDAEVHSVDTASGASYNIRFNWTQPAPGSDDTRWQTGLNAPVIANIIDFHISESDADTAWSRFASQYLITYTNATAAGQPFAQLVVGRGTATQPAIGAYDANYEIVTGTPLVFTTARPFTAGSLYHITIEPQNHVPVRAVAPSPVYFTWTHPLANWQAPSAATPVARDMIFMSDIPVWATGRGDEITVEWLNPLWNGNEIFNGWEITWVNVGTGTEAGSIQIPATGPGIERFAVDGRQRMRFVVTDDTLQIGQAYHVQVEPLRNVGTRLRPNNPNAPGANDMLIDGEMFHIAYRHRSPATLFQTEVPALIVPELSFQVDGANYIRLTWSRIAFSSLVGMVLIEEWADPEQVDPPQGPNYNRSRIEYLPAPHAFDISSWSMGPRDLPATWSIAVLDVNGNLLARSNLVRWLGAGIQEFTPYSPDLEPITATVAGGVGTLQLTWRAFSRPPYNDDERTQILAPPHSNFFSYDDRHFIDTNGISFNIYVADSLAALQAMSEPTTNVPASFPMLTALDHAPGIPFYQLPNGISVFSTVIDGTYNHLNPIQPNGVYFIRIYALRNVAGDIVQQSRSSYGTVNVPPDGDLVLTPEMIASPPLVGRTNQAGDPPHIYLEWPMRYVEMYVPAAIPGRGWHSAAAVVDGEIAPGRRAEFLPGAQRFNSLNNMLSGTNQARLNNRTDLTTSAQIAEFLNAARSDIGSYLGVSTAAPLRLQDMYARSFEIHVVTYNQLMSLSAAAGGNTLGEVFEFYRDIVLANLGAGAWQSIGRPEPDDNGIARFDFNNAAPAGQIQPSTSYVVFFRPVESRAAGHLASVFPAYVVVNTPGVDTPAPALPTVPVLFPHDPPATDHSVTVRWRRQEGLTYNLRWSDTLAGFPNTGTTIPWSEIDGNYTIWRSPQGYDYFVFEITGLFLETVYYVWANATNGDVTSDWSNPVDIRTLPLQPPGPPRSLSPANANLLNQHNVANGTQFAPIEQDALTISFMRNFADMATNTPRATAGTAEGGTAEALTLGTSNALMTVRFSDLMVNRRYHVRARTIVTVTRGTPVQRVYSYEIEVADNEDFMDAIRFTIPPLPGFDPINSRRAYSEWVYIGLTTGRTGDEYDGAFHPDQFPLPESDWEITYDPETQTLVWRFRTNQIGTDGRPDQQVDQRFITRLIQQRVTTFTIDMRGYQGMPITNRVIELPLSIVRAFDDRLITLEIETDEKSVAIPPRAFDIAATRNLQMGIGSNYRITISAVEDGLPTLAPNTSYSSIPQEIRVQAITPARTVTLDTFNSPVEVTLPMDYLISPDGVNTGLFFNGPAGGWRDVSDDFLFGANAIRGGVQSPGTFAAITRNAPPVVGESAVGEASHAAMRRVTARFSITDLVQYNPNQEVTAREFNNMMLALTGNERSVTFDRAISRANQQSLQRARMYAPQDLNNEIAMDILVRLYELRTRQVLRPMSTVGEVPGLSGATPALQNNLLKAADIGFITGPVQPQAPLTMGDFMHMLDILIIDAGM